MWLLGHAIYGMIVLVRQLGSVVGANLGTGDAKSHDNLIITNTYGFVGGDGGSQPTLQNKGFLFSPDHNYGATHDGAGGPWFRSLVMNCPYGRVVRQVDRVRAGWIPAKPRTTLEALRSPNPEDRLTAPARAAAMLLQNLGAQVLGDVRGGQGPGEAFARHPCPLGGVRDGLDVTGHHGVDRARTFLEMRFGASGGTIGAGWSSGARARLADAPYQRRPVNALLGLIFYLFCLWRTKTRKTETAK